VDRAPQARRQRERYWSGICSQVGEVGRDVVFTHYRLEVVPQFWLLTRRAQSRIFQNQSVPTSSARSSTGLDVTFEIQGTFHPRDYCVQYRETDFNFASRLMEEEGIYYFFKHTKDEHRMVVGQYAPEPPGHAPGEPDHLRRERRRRAGRPRGSGAGTRASR